MKQAERYGINFRNCFNQTLLMVAVYAGNASLVGDYYKRVPILIYGIMTNTRRLI